MSTLINNDIHTNFIGVYLQWNIVFMGIVRFKPDDVQNVWNNWDNSNINDQE